MGPSSTETQGNPGELEALVREYREALNVLKSISNYERLVRRMERTLTAFERAYPARSNPRATRCNRVVIGPEVHAIEYFHPDGGRRPYRHVFRGRRPVPVIGEANGHRIVVESPDVIWGKV